MIWIALAEHPEKRGLPRRLRQ